jgi:hypothetical protein
MSTAIAIPGESVRSAIDLTGINTIRTLANLRRASSYQTTTEEIRVHRSRD